MLAVLKYFFLFLGIVFFFILVCGGYLLYSGNFSTSALFSVPTFASPQNSTGKDMASDANPYLSASQETVLRGVGIDPSALPTTLTDVQKTCLLQTVGEGRAREIIGGATPTIAEIYNAKSCF